MVAFEATSCSSRPSGVCALMVFGAAGRLHAAASPRVISAATKRYMGAIYRKRGAPWFETVRLDLERFQRLGREKFLGLQAPLRQSLLVVGAQKRIQHVAIGLESVGPPVLAHLAARFFEMRDH